MPKGRRVRGRAREGVSPKMPQPVLLNPGPVNVSPRVREALLRGDLCHREPEFSDLLAAVRRKLCQAFAPAGYTAVVLSGSGTLAVEAMVASCVPEGRKLLVVNNGVYGDRMRQMADAHRIPTAELCWAWTEPPDSAQLAAALDDDPAIAAVALVHHETTTGLLNPAAEVGALVRRAGRVFLLDAVSALGGETLDLARDGVDACACTANKCIQGQPGVSFVLVRDEAMHAMQRNSADYPRRSLYLHLPLHWEAQGQGGIPFTPSVPAWYALDAALDELLEETPAGRIRRYRGAAELLRGGFDELGLDCLLPPELRSNSLTALRLPHGLDYTDLHDGLKRRGFVIYAGQGALQSEIFRVANMGHLTIDDFRRFLAALAEVLSDGSADMRA